MSSQQHFDPKSLSAPPLVVKGGESPASSESSEGLRRFDALIAVQRRLVEAQQKHPRLHSLHEAYSVLLEEVDELWDEIRRRDVDHQRIREEVLDVAAVACRLLVELV